MKSENPHEILTRIRTTLKPDSKGEYCFACGAEGVANEETAQGEMFVCTTNGCRSPRAFIFDGLALFSFENDLLIHQTAGAIIQRGGERTRQTLLFLRRKFPFQYTLPAGHVEIGNEPENEMRREVQEETGLVVETAVQLFPKALLLEDPCRRGADFHRWHVYQVGARGTVRMSDEARIIGWYSDQEIQQFAEQNLLTSAVHAIFMQLNMLG
jgi:ADP-ribose pyrophosphatase YjhB (NUDIX family)